jgi:hypothetical protein
MELGPTCAPEHLRRLAEAAQKGAPHTSSITEADILCNAVERSMTCLNCDPSHF